MAENNQPYRIRIIKNGPYLVTGNVPLDEKVIVPHGVTEVHFEAGRELPQAKTYSLCRCGKTQKSPFCDGSHERHGFNGRETESKAL